MQHLTGYYVPERAERACSLGAWGGDEDEASVSVSDNDDLASDIAVNGSDDSATGICAIAAAPDDDSDDDEDYVPGASAAALSSGAGAMAASGPDPSSSSSSSDDGDSSSDSSSGSGGSSSSNGSSESGGVQQPTAKRRSAGREALPLAAKHMAADVGSGSRSGKRQRSSDSSPESSPASAISPPTTATKAEAKTKGGWRRLRDGVEMKVITEGSGAVAQRGMLCKVYYVGRLLANGEKFDACESGTPFSFRLGRAEVIPGWDIGIAGMRIGGSRLLKVPAKQAYGVQGAPPVIPPLSALMFEVRLVDVRTSKRAAKRTKHRR